MSAVDATNGIEAEAQSSTKAKLNDILESFHAFDTDMKMGTRTRREKDEHRITQLTSELTRLEKTLNQEIKRRIEMNKSVQTVSEYILVTMSTCDHCIWGVSNMLCSTKFFCDLSQCFHMHLVSTSLYSSNEDPMTHSSVW